MLLLTKYYYVDKIKEDEMVQSFSIHGRKELLIQGFSRKMGGGSSPFGKHRHRWEDTIKIWHEMNCKA